MCSHLVQPKEKRYSYCKRKRIWVCISFLLTLESSGVFNALFNLRTRMINRRFTVEFIFCADYLHLPFFLSMCLLRENDRYLTEHGCVWCNITICGLATHQSEKMSRLSESSLFMTRLSDSWVFSENWFLTGLLLFIVGEWSSSTARWDVCDGEALYTGWGQTPGHHYCPGAGAWTAERRASQRGSEKQKVCLHSHRTVELVFWTWPSLFASQLSDVQQTRGQLLKVSDQISSSLRNSQEQLSQWLQQARDQLEEARSASARLHAELHSKEQLLQSANENLLIKVHDSPPQTTFSYYISIHSPNRLSNVGSIPASQADGSETNWIDGQSQIKHFTCKYN